MPIRRKRWRWAAAFTCLVAAVLALSSCLPFWDRYDFNALYDDGPLKYYAPDGQVVSRMGVDVAEHQDDIDWYLVREAGIDFAMLRVGYRGYTEGVLFEDVTFRDNAWEAWDAGLDVGAYFFSQAVDEEEAREEAAMTVQILQETGVPLTYPVAFDLETDVSPNARTAELSRHQISLNARAFCEVIEQAGYTPMVYLNRKDVVFHFEAGTMSDYPLWLAQYDSERPSVDFGFVMWQYTNQGSIDGIDTPVDLNIAFHDLAS